MNRCHLVFPDINLHTKRGLHRKGGGEVWVHARFKKAEPLAHVRLCLSVRIHPLGQSESTVVERRAPSARRRASDATYAEATAFRQHVQRAWAVVPGATKWGRGRGSGGGGGGGGGGGARMSVNNTLALARDGHAVNHHRTD
jgi:hypothetical protein